MDEDKQILFEPFWRMETAITHALDSCSTLMRSSLVKTAYHGDVDRDRLPSDLNSCNSCRSDSVAFDSSLSTAHSSIALSSVMASSSTKAISSFKKYFSCYKSNTLFWTAVLLSTAASFAAIFVSSFRTTSFLSSQLEHDLFIIPKWKLRIKSTSTTSIYNNSIQDSFWSSSSQKETFFSVTDRSLSVSPSSRRDKAIRDFYESTLLPDWMKNYFTWHSQQRSQLTPENWNQHRIFLVRCFRIDHRCGGASDRLQSLPTYILMAHITRRILLFYWERPAPLEEFLVPSGPLDWRVPKWMNLNQSTVPEIWSVKHFEMHFNESTEKGGYPQQLILQARMQVADYGSVFFNEYHANLKSCQQVAQKYKYGVKQETNYFRAIYRQVWQAVFRPSKPVEIAIQQARLSLGLPATSEHLQPQERYAAVHIRSIYTTDHTANAQMSRNAVDCIHQLSKHAQPPASNSLPPILVATDNPEVTKRAVQYGQRSLRRNMLSAPTAEQEILHLDRGSSFLEQKSQKWDSHVFPPSAYYNVFVDLYLLADAHCVAYHFGGYGRWGLALSQNITCGINFGSSICNATGLYDKNEVFAIHRRRRL